VGSSGRLRALFGAVAIASCGSRTGLFGPEPSDLVPPPPDAAVAVRDADPPIPTDAESDAARDASLDGPVACVPGTFTFALARPQLMFVLDRSGSMDFALDRNDDPPLGEPTRWSVLRSSLATALLPFSDAIEMGARFFPSRTAAPFDPAGACFQDDPGFAIAPALGNAARIVGTFDTTSPVGGTPTAVALDLAATQISAQRGIARAMVLTTDGAPNCNAALDNRTCVCTSSDPNACRNSGGSGSCLDDTRTVATIERIVASLALPVYVVGIGVTSSFASTLDRMAVAGGRPRTETPRYIPAETPEELTRAFTLVRDSVARCSYITPSSPRDPDAIDVTVDGVPVARDTTRVSGWDWIDRAYGHLQLFGPACERASTTNVGGTVSCRDE